MTPLVRLRSEQVTGGGSVAIVVTVVGTVGDSAVVIMMVEGAVVAKNPPQHYTNIYLQCCVHSYTPN